MEKDHDMVVFCHCVSIFVFYGQSILPTTCLRWRVGHLPNLPAPGWDSGKQARKQSIRSPVGLPHKEVTQIEAPA